MLTPGAGATCANATVMEGVATRIRVLFVENDQPCAKAFSRSLGMYGIDTMIADSLGSARRFMGTSPDCPDAVLLDLYLPDGRGEELLPDIEALPKQPGVVIFSNFLDEIRPEATSYRAAWATKMTAPSVLASILRLAANGYAHSTLDRFARYFGLTSKESAFLERLANGTSPKEIAKDWGCSKQAVYAHLAKIGRKTKSAGNQEVLAKLFLFSCHGLGHPIAAMTLLGSCEADGKPF